MQLSKYILLFIVFIGFSLTRNVSGQAVADSSLPTDSQVVTGRLPNGMVYYLRHNEEPKGRVSFSLIRNAGALLENDAQNGLAHFLEHMAFQGTAHFPGKGIVQTLERHGVSFGADINAYTSYNETVYSLSDVPTQDTDLLDTCLLILHDWTSFLTLSDEEIDAERGVIAEEWRTRRTADFRVRQKLWPVLFRDSRYAVRDVIGSLEVIRNFPYHEIRDFYREWYRTDLEAIAIAGDIDVAAMEQKIISLFSEIPAVENPKPRPFFDIPYHEDLYYCLSTDKEVGESSVQLMTVLPATPDSAKNTRAYLRYDLIAGLFNAMTASRISELMQQGHTPFLKGYIQYAGLVRGYDIYTIFAGCRSNEEARALEAILTENERILRYGFTPGELERAKKNMLLTLESKCRGKKNNEQCLEEIRNHFLESEPLMDAEFYYKTADSILSGLTVEDIQAEVRKWNTAANRTIAVMGKSEIPHLSRETCMEIMDRISSTSVSPYEDQTTDAPLLSDELTGSEIVSVKSLPMFSAEEWTLGNGAKVVYRHADYEKDNVALIAYSPGGTSLYGLDLFPSASTVASFVPGYGLGNFDAVTLNRVLTGKKVSCNVALTEFGESLQGSSTPQDFETLLQLLYLRFEHPRFDKDAHETMIDRNRAVVAAKGIGGAMGDSLLLQLNDHHPRTPLLDDAFLDRISLAQIEQVYRDRFRDASDFTFFLVGNLTAEQVKPLVEKYIGSLRSEYRKEKWRDNGVRFPKGKTEKAIEFDLVEPKSTVYLQYERELAYTPYHTMCANIMQQILMSRLIESIREQEGGTYTPYVQAKATDIPYARYDLVVSFECDPEKARYLKSLVYAEVDRLKNESPSQIELDNVIASFRKEREQAKAHNSYWMRCLMNYYISGINTDDAKNYENILDRLRPEELRKFAKTFFEKAAVVDVIFEPVW